MDVYQKKKKLIYGSIWGMKKICFYIYIYIYIYNLFEYYKIVYLYSFIVKVTKFEATS